MQSFHSATRPLAVALCATLLGLSFALADHKPGHNPGRGGGSDGGSAPYQLVDLMGLTGVYSGGTFVQSSANAVCEPLSGAVLVVGHSWTPNDDGSAGNSPHPVLWEVDGDGGFMVSDLGLPPGATEATASDVNGWGAITINTLNPSNAIRAWVDVPGLPLQELPTNAQFVRSHAINNSGTVVGRDTTFDSAPGLIWHLDPSGTPSNAASLGLFHPWDIDQSGTMAGYEYDAATGIRAPAIAWFDENGTLQVEHLVPPDPEDWFNVPNGEATAISSNGTWVTGWLYDLDTQTTQAFVWSRATGPSMLGRLGGQASVALGVNDAGQVVGWSDTNDLKRPRAASLWDAGQMFDLNALAAAGSKIQLKEANAINNAGHVVGLMGVTRGRNSEEHAFLLVPQAP